MNSKFYSCKNPLQSTIHQPLQIRTNKHRCFVFCIGHTSLTCVPGIGKKNKHLLNQSGIDDLTTLYQKYRSINNIQRFQRWLERDIGFTSYQAKMTTCGIGSKLGDIKEINTGLIPICCPTKEKRNQSIELKENKKRKIENIKSEELSPNSNQDRIESKDESFLSIVSPKNDQIFSSSKEKLLNKLSDDYLPGVKSPDNRIFVTRPRPNPNKINQTSEIKSTKLYSSLMMDEIDSSTSLNKSKVSSSTSELFDQTLSTIQSSDSSAEIKSSINHTSSFDEKKSLLPHFNPDDQTNVRLKTEKLDEIFILTKEKLQPTLDALQGKKDELLSASKYLSDTTSANEYSNKSRLHSPQSTFPINTDISYAAIKQKLYQQQAENRPLETTASFDTDSNEKSKSDENDSKNTTDMERNSFNELYEKVSKAVSQIMKQAARIVHDKRPLKSKDSTSTQVLTKSTDNEDSSIQNKTTSTHGSAPNQYNKKSIESNPNEKLKSIQSKTHPNDNVQSTLTTRLPITTNISLTTNKSSESMKTKLFNKKKSLSTLSSLSNSNQSINRIPLSIDKIQPTSSNVDQFDEETKLKTTDDSEEHDRLLLTSSTTNDHSKKEKSDAPTLPSVKESSHVTNTNLSEKENSTYQSSSSPSTPTPCHALWSNISNEKILFQRKKPHLCSLKKGRSNQNDHNQNHHSSTGLFTDFTRQQYFKENENLDEHILYIKRIKTLYKS